MKDLLMQLNKERKVVIACSGGPDSTYLFFHALKNISQEKIIVAHFNHKIRVEWDADEKFVKNISQENKIIFESESQDIEKLSKKNKTSIEETARIYRYEFLEKIRKKYDAGAILTAHTLDDQIETLMYRLIKGTKIHGLTGIPKKNNFIQRPLLKISKKEILSYLDSHNISYCIDHTNNKNIYMRNRIRNTIISEFHTINPEYQKSFSQIISYFQEAKNFFDSEIQKVLEENILDLEKYFSFHPFLQKECIRYIYEYCNSGTEWLSEGNITEIDKFFRGPGNPTKKEIKKMSLTKKNKKVFIKRINLQK